MPPSLGKAMAKDAPDAPKRTQMLINFGVGFSLRAPSYIRVGVYSCTLLGLGYSNNTDFGTKTTDLCTALSLCQTKPGKA